MSTEFFIEKTCKALNCSRRILAGLAGGSLASSVSKKRIEALYYIVVKHLATLSPQARFAIINKPVFEDFSGNQDSVVSAIIQDKYDLPTLDNIAAIAWRAYKEEELKDCLSVPAEASLSD